MLSFGPRSFGRRSLLARLAGSAAVLGVFAFASAAKTRAAGTDIGEIAKLRGTARLLRGNTSQFAKQGMSLDIGDILLTGPDARLRVRLLDGSMLTLGENSRLVIDQASFDPASGDREVGVSLFDGILRSSVAKVKGRSVFEVKSNLVASAARSTEWVLELKGPAASLMVIEGTVAATATAETVEDLPDSPIAKGVDLEAGYGMLIGPPTRMLGVPLADLGRPIKWPTAKIKKLETATDF